MKFEMRMFLKNIAKLKTSFLKVKNLSFFLTIMQELHLQVLFKLQLSIIYLLSILFTNIAIAYRF